jgi:hypothetical protein
MRVSVEDGRIVAVEPFALDAARWGHERVDITGLGEDEAIKARIGAALTTAQAAAHGRPLALRLTLTGATPAHARLVARLDEWRDEARGLGFRVAADLWVEKLRLETSSPEALPDPEGLDIGPLVAAAAQDPEYLRSLEDLAASVADKLPRELRGEFLKTASSERAAWARDLLTGARA